jgi:hypothetical protein
MCQTGLLRGKEKEWPRNYTTGRSNNISLSSKDIPEYCQIISYWNFEELEDSGEARITRDNLDLNLNKVGWGNIETYNEAHKRDPKGNRQRHLGYQIRKLHYSISLRLG